MTTKEAFKPDKANLDLINKDAQKQIAPSSTDQKEQLKSDEVTVKKSLIPAQHTVSTGKNQNAPHRTAPKQKKIGHRRIDAETGQTTYKKTPSSALSGSIQLGISHTVAGLSSKPERDVLMQDFQVVETITFPDTGSSITPAHHFGDFTFRTYAPTAFRYFRDLFGIQPDDYMLSISEHPLTELSNPGASGSLFFVTHDDEFIIKTVQHKEAEFLQKLLPGYYMNLVQNPRTLLPKFYGLYNVQSGGKNIRVVVMNNLLPRKIEMHLKYDLKGSTYKRKASKSERSKKHPTFKDLDLLHDSQGALLSPDNHSLLLQTLQRDCLVLQSFKIMDYSLLLGIHNIDRARRDAELKDPTYEKKRTIVKTRTRKIKSQDSRPTSVDYNSDGGASDTSLIGVRGNHSVMASTILRKKYTAELDRWSQGIPAKNDKGEQLLVFCGIIDILQCCKLKKKMEHTWKSLIADGDTVSVHRPKFYCDRFQKFMSENVFRKDPTVVSRQPTKKRPSSRRGPTSATLRQNTQTSSIASSSAASTVIVQAAGTNSMGIRPDLLPDESHPRAVSSSDEEPRTLQPQSANQSSNNHYPHDFGINRAPHMPKTRSHTYIQRENSSSDVISGPVKPNTEELGGSRKGSPVVLPRSLHPNQIELEMKDGSSSGAEEDIVADELLSRPLNGTDFRRGTMQRRTTGF